MHSLSYASGVYQILCVPTGKIYIGSTSDLCTRWREHRWTLNRGTHHSQYLQRAWDKYGETAFIFSVLELVLPESLLQAEQQWINKTRCYERNRGFNICSAAGSVLGIKRSDVTRQKMSDALGQLHVGFVDPGGNLVVIDNMMRFCREQGLNPELMYRLADQNGRHRSYRGWTFTGNINQQERRYEGFLSPTGEYTTIINLTKFCREHNLIQSHMWKLYQGKRVSHKGRKHTNGYHKHQRVKYEGFVDPEGEPIPPIEDIKHFCLAHGLIPNHMYEVYHGKRRHHKGWMCERIKDTLNE
ncbi:MAG: GIY-YIG nuclease family protein [Chloroflexota bacterium]|nr:GIY-YIG nuclease family protein [Chloroflexota bacterium]